VGFAAGQDMSIPNVNQWAVLLALVIIGGLFGHSLMNWSLTRIPLWIGSTLTLLIPIVSSLIAWIALDEALTAIQLGAIGLVIIALSVIITSQRNPTPTPPPTAPLTSDTTDSLSGDTKPASPPNP
jgi:drug/metabolite transporter (DMT)-like permease